jgi:small-conductance mechanosensitive channel
MQTTTTTPPPPDFLINPIGYIMYFINLLFPYIMIVVSLIILMILYFVLTRLVKRSLFSIGMGIEAATGIVLILRLIFFMAAIMIIISAFEASLATILSISAIFGTALGLAFSQALGNIVSGLYVLAARPFRVGDYVRVGNVEGIVREITLNYTKVLLSDETRQLLPNSKVVSSEVTNFRVSVSQLLKDEVAQKADAAEEKERKSYIRTIDNAIGKLRNMASDADAFKYTFDMSIHMNYDQREMQKQFDKVCSDYEEIFLTRPTYQIWAKPVAAVTYRFTFIVDDPMMIIKMTSVFMNDLLKYYIEGTK